MWWMMSVGCVDQGGVAVCVTWLCSYQSTVDVLSAHSMYVASTHSTYTHRHIKTHTQQLLQQHTHSHKQTKTHTQQ